MISIITTSEGKNFNAFLGKRTLMERRLINYYSVHIICLCFFDILIF